MASRNLKSPHSTEADETETKAKCSRVERRESSPEQSELYNEDLWGTCEDGEQKLAKYSDRQLLQPGAFSKVETGRKDGIVYALKLIPKVSRQKGLTRQLQAVYATRELRALRDLKGMLFINNLYDRFQTPSEMVLVLDFVDGGDLFDVISKKHTDKESFSEGEIRFYLAEIVLGLEAVHKKNIVHRDIKVENVLVSKDGHVQLTDFGLCKYLNDEDSGMGGRKSPVAGSTEHVAPEILDKEWKKDNCDFAQDWYAFGVLALRMYVGERHFPYGGPEIKRHNPNNWPALKEIVIRSMRAGNLDIPARSCSGKEMSVLRDLLTKLLKVPCNERLGSNGTDEIKQHPFFKDVSWEDAANKKLTPPQRHSDSSQ